MGLGFGVRVGVRARVRVREALHAEVLKRL